MKKQKMTADNVEQLMEIVRAIQNGQEPEEALRKKETESAPLADSPKSRPEKESLPEKELFDEDRFEEDDFERNLEADGAGGLNLKPVKNVIGAGAEKLSGLLKRKDRRTKRKTEEDSEEKKSFEAEKDSEEKEGFEAEADSEEKKGSEAEPGAEGQESLYREDPEEETRSEQEKEQDEIAINRLLDRDDLAAADSDDEDKNPETAQKSGQGKLKERIRVAKGIRGIQVKDVILNFRESLIQKGIRKKELFMLGAGLVLVILIILLIVNSVRASVQEKKKAEHVTAEEGLTVLVEQEPESWCSSGPVTLRFRASGADISGITIDGAAYTPDEKGEVTVNASDYLLEAEVSTGGGSLKAQIEVPMIDAQPPVVNVEKEEDKIIATAVDARSSVVGIWYAQVKNGAFQQIPLYRKYSDSLTFEKDTAYYFYAEDMAGNRSDIIVTTMEPVEELKLGSETLSLFPEETRYLQLEASPTGALLNNLKFESANPEVATVDGSGAVTAAGEGSTVITVSADGAAAVSCAVEVSSSRTVTISAIGDCTLGADESFNTSTSFPAFDAVNGHDYFFRNVKEILENDDATFANMEGTLTTETSREMKEYAFKGDPSYTEILKSGSVEVVTLANNHSSDYGAKSLTDTKQYLQEAGIDYCIGDEIVLRDVNGIRTAFIGIYVLNDGMARESQVRETIASAKAQGAQLIITAFHWGSERASQPDETQQSLAHIAVDCGADLVVGHHPHVLEGIENYNGKYIVYSLGNFCFGGNSAPSDTDTMIFRQTFQVDQNGVLPESEVEIIPCSITSVQGYNNYQPTPAQGTEAERILDRVNEYSSAFGQSFTASGGLE